ncbi:hypothetical protein PBRA_004827 [Plasmodiophora brassicae]|uniref:Tetratricopeptide repeat-like domain-containing protein n=1 Tax=Plasmodiophora brassicae TaxID=37360 RepID=A0A0G4IM18_PLABS|nr:hypothetical protein PBRA_004827 [Plasmodiophora brassicae]
MKRSDSESVADLKQQLKSSSRTKDTETLLTAANYFWLTGKHQQARQCLDRVLGDNANQMDALVLMGWVNVTCGDDQLAQKSVTYFNQAFTLLLGRAKWYEISQRLKLADDHINMVLATETWFAPAAVEKARMQLALKMPEDAAETVQRILKNDPVNVDALFISTLLTLTRGSDTARSALLAQNLLNSVQASEGRNANLFYSIARLLSRACSKDKTILDIAGSFIDVAVRLNPTSSAIRTEQAYVQFQRDDITASLQSYSEASQLDEGNTAAINGMIRCKIARGQFDDAAHELDFLSEIQKDSDERSEANVEMHILKGLMAKRRGVNGTDQARQFFVRALSAHRGRLEEVKLTPEYIVAYNVDMVMDVIEEILDGECSSPRLETDPLRPTLSLSCDLLQEVLAIVPGAIRPHIMVARALFLDGKFTVAETSLKAANRIDPRLTESRLMRAQIELLRQNWGEAADALEEALSLDFNVRHTAKYHIIQTQLLEAKGSADEALSLVQSAMNLPGVRHVSPRSPVAIHDRATLYLLAAQLHARHNRAPEAAKLLQDARNEFESTPEYDRILIADAEIAASCRSDVEAALRMLRKVPAQSPYLSRARIAIANLYLEHRRNRREYVKCFEEMAAADPRSVHALRLLGEAHLRVQDPQKAISAFEAAIDLAIETGEPVDPVMVNKIGVALVTCHEYERALIYYETAIAEGRGSNLSLSVDLAQLLSNLARLEDAQRVLLAVLTPYGDVPGSGKVCIDDAPGDDSVSSLIERVSALLLLNDITTRIEPAPAEGCPVLMRAYELQKRVLDLQRMAGSSATVVNAHKEKVAAIACQIASSLKKAGKSNIDKVEFYYQDAVRVCPAHEEALMALASLRLASGATDDCQQHLTALLKASPGNVKASLLLADVKFKLNEQDNAIAYFKAILESDPSNFHVLDKLVQCLKRSGQLVDAQRYMLAAQRGSADMPPGLHFIQGMVDLADKKPRDALHHLNVARTDPEWARRALFEMCEIYLTPENRALFGSAEDQSHLDTARHLLSELATRIGDGDDDARERLHTLQAYATIASGNVEQINALVPELVAAVQANRDFVPGYLALAHAFVTLKEPPKARNQLKIVANMTPSVKYMDVFEKAWLMLADIYMRAGAADLAQKLCRRCLEHNRSSGRAWELLGEITDVEGSFSDAAQYLENAWQCQHETSSAVGYKLAFSYLKAKRYIEAIEVAHKVLKKNPECTQLKTDVIDKCRLCLRP